MDIEQYVRYEVELKLRPSYNGQPVKPAWKALDGQQIAVKALYQMDEGDKYPGEWAMLLPEDAMDATHTPWIASGDVVVLRRAESQ